MPVSDIVLIIMGLLAVAMVAAAVCRNLPIPFTVILVLLGMLVATVAERVPELASLREFHLTPDLVFFVFLPALIFESALNLDARQLTKDIAPIMALAVPALIVSTFIIGAGVWAYTELPLTLALLFGALIAATDPVAVVALFKELGAPARLTTLVEGESLFNDATAIVMFKILLGIAVVGSFTAGDLGHAALEFVRVFFGGVVIGIVFGFGVAELMRRIRSSELAILVMSLVMAYASFVFAEHVVHVSGVMAAVSAAVAMGLYAVTRIPQSALRLIHETWEMIALVCNSLLFLMIGMSVDLSVLFERFDGILVAAALVLIARAASVYTLVPATTRLFKLPHINMGERHIMWWGGLKGGLAIAIVLSIPQQLAGRQILIELTLGVVLFTLLVNAPTIRPLIRRLGIDRMSEGELAELKRGLLDAERQAGAVIERLVGARLLDAERSRQIGTELHDMFAAEAPATAATRQYKHAYLEALQIETDDLENLYRLGLVQEYTYLDLRTRLRRDRDAWSTADPHGGVGDQAEPSPFLRMEQTILRWMREQNWLAPVLARFQRLRLSQGLQRDIAGILCGEAVLAKLRDRPGLRAEDVAKITGIYSARVARKRQRVEAIKQDFPEFYWSIEQRLSHLAALESARNLIKTSHHHANIGAKAYARIERLIDEAVNDVPEIVNPTGAVSAAELIERVPLFSGLSAAAIEKLVQSLQNVTFLPGDVVIGQRERGNALYIIDQGKVDVFKSDGAGEAAKIASLSQGDFFGEAALLGDEVRTATVKAATPLTLLRLTRRNIQNLAREHREIEQRLAEARRARA